MLTRKNHSVIFCFVCKTHLPLHLYCILPWLLHISFFLCCLWIILLLGNRIHFPLTCQDLCWEVATVHLRHYKVTLHRCRCALPSSRSRPLSFKIHYWWRSHLRESDTPQRLRNYTHSQLQSQGKQSTKIPQKSMANTSVQMMPCSL